MYKLKIKLKQHTPLIHFQHDHHGATIRATELKPKLNKFFLQKMEQEGFDKEEFLTADTDHKILDFNVWILDISEYNENVVERVADIERIEKFGNGNIKYKLTREYNNWKKNRSGEEPAKYKKDKKTNEKIPEISQYPFYFANMGEQTDNKKLVFLNSTTIEITSFNKKLLHYIKNKEKLAEFFMKTNFGTRQSKGFGSFYIDQNDELYIEPQSTYAFTINVSDPKIDNFYGDKEYYKVKHMFQICEYFYKTLRSGINQQGVYFKSMLFLYGHSQSPTWQWDKRTIREHYLLQDYNYKKIKENRKDKEGTVHKTGEKKDLLVRDLLGLSTVQSWIKYRDRITKKHEDNNITRFKSPITFKPIRISKNEFKIFLIPDDIPKELLGEKFLITSKKNSKRPKLKLTTPPNFNLNDYLNFCFKKAFIESHKFSETKFYKHVNKRKELTESLCDIYKQLSEC